MLLHVQYITVYGDFSEALLWFSTAFWGVKSPRAEPPCIFPLPRVIYRDATGTVPKSRKLSLDRGSGGRAFSQSELPRKPPIDTHGRYTYMYTIHARGNERKKEKKKKKKSRKVWKSRKVRKSRNSDKSRKNGIPEFIRLPIHFSSSSLFLFVSAFHSKFWEQHYRWESFLLYNYNSHHIQWTPQAQNSSIFLKIALLTVIHN